MIHRLSPARFRTWTVPELNLAVIVVLVVVIPLTFKVSYSGTWDGEPSTYNRFVQDSVGIFAREHANGGDPWRAFLQCYYMLQRCCAQNCLPHH